MTYNGLTTKFQEPPLTKVGGAPSNGRWTWWYSAIADAMIRHPDKKVKEIAVILNKHPNYISMVINTDLFKEYLAQRKEVWRAEHDHMLRAKLTDAASEGLDIVLEQLKTKRSQIPLNVALRVTESALDRLGYAPDAQPAVVVNNNNIDARQQSVNVSGLSAHDLEEARAALRRVEQAKIGTSFAPLMTSAAPERGAGPDVGDVIDAPVEEVLSDTSA